VFFPYFTLHYLTSVNTPIRAISNPEARLIEERARGKVYCPSRETTVLRNSHQRGDPEATPAASSMAAGWLPFVSARPHPANTAVKNRMPGALKRVFPVQASQTS